MGCRDLISHSWMGTLSLWLLSVSLTAPEKGPHISGYILAVFSSKPEVQGSCPPPYVISMRLAVQRWTMQLEYLRVFVQLQKRHLEPIFPAQRLFPIKGRFICTCNSAILGQTNEQDFHCKILANYQEGGFLLGISSTISVTAFSSLPTAYLWSLAEPSCFVDAISLGILIMDIIFFRASFHYLGFLSVCHMSN